MFAIYKAARVILQDATKCDEKKKQCRMCQKGFNVFRRRNHCHGCDEYFCKDCMDDNGKDVKYKLTICLYCADTSQKRLRRCSSSDGESKQTRFITFEEPVTILEGRHFSFHERVSTLTARSSYESFISLEDEMNQIFDPIFPRQDLEWNRDTSIIIC